MIILGIETSCDETAVAVIKDGKLLSDVISSQYFHSNYGGVVPELASRAHLKSIVPIFNEALEKSGVVKKDINAVAATYGPGLIGSLLVGLNFGKALSAGLKIPFIGINHIEAHLLSVFLEEKKPEFPYISLIVSGGHTLVIKVNDFFNYKILGSTKDDSAGEAYDKVAKMLGLGYPGGPIIDKFAKDGNPNFVRFPRPCLDSGDYDFSFSGLKTSVLYYLRNLKKDKPLFDFADKKFINDICASFQEAVISVLTGKLINAAKINNIQNISIVGGVSANRGLRDKITFLSEKNNLNLFIPNLKFSTDNAAMVGMVGHYYFNINKFFSKETVASPNLTLNEQDRT